MARTGCHILFYLCPVLNEKPLVFKFNKAMQIVLLSSWEAVVNDQSILSWRSLIELCSVAYPLWEKWHSKSGSKEVSWISFSSSISFWGKRQPKGHISFSLSSSSCIFSLGTSNLDYLFRGWSIKNTSRENNTCL